MARGTEISGWWAWYPSYGGAYARRFPTREGAEGYFPLTKNKKPVLGPRYIMRVGYGEAEGKYGWNNDAPIIQSQEQVQELFISQGELNAAERPAA